VVGKSISEKNLRKFVNCFSCDGAYTDSRLGGVMNLIFPKRQRAENECNSHSFEQCMIGADSVSINSETLVLCSEAAEDIF
jgi:hypothetical protein